MKRVSGTLQTVLRNAFRRALTGDRVNKTLPPSLRLLGTWENQGGRA